MIEPPSRVTQRTAQRRTSTKSAHREGSHRLRRRAGKVPVTIIPPVKRRDDAEVRAHVRSARIRRQAGLPGGPQTPADTERRLLPATWSTEQFDQFLVSAGALARVNDAGRDHGQIRAFNNATFDVTKVVPTLVMRNEDYGRIARLLADKMDVQLEINIVNHTYPEGTTQYNVIAEIPGTDKAQEVVMLGGHLDSWHSATGATDNAIGCTVMMEAIRILQAVGVKPRRTIRLALWSGEEQGLLGSQAYVKEHFGTFENPKPDYANFAGYFNIDSGTGRARGMTVFGPPEAAAILRQALAPFADRASPAPRSRAAVAVAARITPRSTKPACPASACSRIRSNTTRTPGTPTSTPTSASSKAMRRRRRWPSPAPCTTSRCATRSCRASRRSRCRRCRRRRRRSDE